MRKTTVLGLILVLALALLAACGGDDDGASSSSSSSQPAASSSQKAPSGGGITLEQYAADHAGGVGAIYVGDLKQLVGPAATVDQGDFDGNVPLSALENHIWVYESDFYKKALEKANLTNPTPLTSEGVSIQIQHACINRALGPCKVLDSILSPNIKERTNGQLEFVVSSFPELGLAGPDTVSYTHLTLPTILLV